MDKSEALKVWNQEIGDKEYSYDFTGRKMKRDDYLVQNQVGWVVSYMRPLSKGGKNDDGNVILVHHRTDEDKGDQYPEFSLDGISYVVKHDARDDYYFIEKIDDDVDEEDDDFYETEVDMK